MKFEQGEILRDIVTGFQGTVLSRTKYFTGCVHYGLSPQTLKDGKLPDWEWIDETRLTEVEGATKIIGGLKSLKFSQNKFELGEVLKDKVTGFKGVAMGRTDYYTGCINYGLCPQLLKEEKSIEWEWFDETRLIRMKKGKNVLEEPEIKTSGPHPNSPQM